MCSRMVYRFPENISCRNKYGLTASSLAKNPTCVELWRGTGIGSEPKSEALLEDNLYWKRAETSAQVASSLHDL